MDTGGLLNNISGHSGNILSLAVTSDEKFVVSAGMQGTISVWNLNKKIIQYELKGHKGWISSLSLTINNKYILTGGSDGTFCI
jgi:FOG: WD40 repeat